ncbi:MAG: hypothetical protein ACRCSK_04445 [Fusobacteriaceae bacterium]
MSCTIEELKQLQKIISQYFKKSGFTQTDIVKKKILSKQTLNKVMELKQCSSSTLEKISNFPNMAKEERKILKKIMNKKEKYSNHNNKKYSNSQKNELKYLKTILTLEEKINQLEIKNRIYIENAIDNKSRKLASYKNDFETLSFLIQVMWDFNDEISKKWADFRMLLAINNPKDNLKIKKGLTSIADTIFKIHNEIYNEIKTKETLQEKNVISLDGEE